MTPGGQGILIVGLGQELRGDDGLGVNVARRLIERAGALPPGVRVCEAGNCVFDILPLFARYSRVIVVDALQCGGKPGTVYRGEITRDNLASPNGSLGVSLHEWGVLETLRAAYMLDMLPARVMVIGAEPDALLPGIGLSATVERAAEEIVGLLIDELGSEKLAIPAA